MLTDGTALLHYAAALLVSVRVLLRPRLEPTVRLSWILVVELVPLIGIIAYVLFGEIRLRGAEVQRMADVRDHLSGLWQRSRHSVDEGLGYAAPMVAAARATGGFEAVSGNRVELLSEEDSAIDDMVAAIDEAKGHVHILFYIWLDDVSGRKMAEAAIRAAQRGVKARVIVDAIGSRAFTWSETWSRMKASAAESPW